MEEGVSLERRSVPLMMVSGEGVIAEATSAESFRVALVMVSLG